MQSNTLPPVPKTVFEAFILYKENCYQTELEVFEFMILKCAVAGWKPTLVDQNQDIGNSQAQNFLEKLSIRKLGEVLDVVEKGCELLGLKKRDRNKYCNRAEIFKEYSVAQGWVPKSKSAKAPAKNMPGGEHYTLQPRNGEHTSSFSTSKAKRANDFGLGTYSEDFIIEDITFNRKNFESLFCLAVRTKFRVSNLFNLFVYEHVLGNRKLQEDLNKLEAKFGKSPSWKQLYYKASHLLGYAYRIKKVPLKELRLTTIVPFVKTEYSDADFSGDPDFALNQNGQYKYPEKASQRLDTLESIAKRSIRKASSDLVDWLEAYFSSCDEARIKAGSKDGLSDATKSRLVDYVIDIACCIYGLTRKTDPFKNHQIIKKLNELRNRYLPNLGEQKARVDNRCVTWEEAIRVIEKQREKADIRHRSPQREYYTGRLSPLRRYASAISADIQKLIALLLMVLIPTDRQETYCRIQYRETIKIKEEWEGVYILCGDVINDVLYPRAKLANPLKAQWWLGVNESKTEQTYPDPFWYPLPNQEFKDGKTFYEYLEMWWFGLEDTQEKWPKYYDGENSRWQGFIDEMGNRHGWRTALEADHDFFFSMSTAKLPFNDTTFRDLVKNVFILFTPDVVGQTVAVTPHSFRTMLATYTEGRLTNVEEKSMAYCEHHSVEVRRKNYTLSDNMKKIAPAVKAMERINNHLFIKCRSEELLVDNSDPSSQPAELAEEKPTTVFDALEIYSEEDSKNSPMVRTAVERFASAAWGGPLLEKGQKVIPETREFLKRIPAYQIKDVIDAVERGCDLLKLDASAKRKYRSYAKSLFEFSKSRGWLSSSNAQINFLIADEDDSSQETATESDDAANVKRSSRIKLGMYSSDYILLGDQKILGNLQLQEELNALNDYIRALVAEKTYRNLSSAILRLLGFLHRVQGIELADLRLSQLVPFIKLKYSKEDLPDDFTHSDPLVIENRLVQLESLALRRARQEAEKVLKWSEVYLEWVKQDRIRAGEPDGLGSGSKHATFDALNMLSRFTYQSETDFSDFSDIPIITTLRDARKGFPRDEKRQKARVAERCITWEEVIDVAEMQRKTADERRYIHRRASGENSSERRLPQSIASEIQKLFALLFFILIPSDRQQTLRRLQYVESIRVREKTEGVFLLCGGFVDNEFVPKAKLKSQKQAQWWLAVYEFKTFDIYGPFWYPVPNQKFIDGKTFYEYLEMWLFGLEDVQGKWESYYRRGNNVAWQGYIDENGNRHGWRAALEPEDHNFVFSCPVTKKPYDPVDNVGFTYLVQRIFEKYTPLLSRREEVPVTPQSMRTMWATYTRELLSEEEEQSMAYCEHHSVETRRGAYTLSDNLKQIAPAQQVMSRISNDLFLRGR